MKEKKRPLSVNLAYFFGGLSIVGAITTFILGFLFAIVAVVCSIIAMKKQKAEFKINIPWIIGIILNIIVVIFVVITSFPNTI